MVDFTAGSNVNRCVTGGLKGDFKWPFNVPDGAFGPWSPRCTSEVLDPTAACKPYVPGKPCNFKELAWMLSEVLHAVVTLCHDIPPADSNGDYDWVDPRLIAIDTWLDFNWLGCFNDFSDTLKQSVRHYVFVILKEATLRRNYVYFTKYPELQNALKTIYDNFDGCSWLVLDERLTRVMEIIFSYGSNKPLMSLQLNTQITNALDVDWVKANNDDLNTKKDYSILVADQIVALKLNLTETLKRYSENPDVLKFEIIQKQCGINLTYNLQYGNGKFNVRNTRDFLTVVKSVFGS